MEWPFGVAYYGISRAYKVTANKEYLKSEYLEGI